ncbi:MAG: hypothetical protein AAFP19_03475 [Bacteroidota bacterium]
MKHYYKLITILIVSFLHNGCEEIPIGKAKKNGLYGPVKSFTQEVYMPIYKNGKLEKWIKGEHSIKEGNFSKVYDEAGNLTEWHLFDNKAKQTDRTIYFYHKDSLLQEEHYWSPRQQYVLKYKYDQNNRKSEVLKYDKNDELLSTYFFEYDADQNRIAEFEVSNQKDTIVLRRMVYDKHSQLKKETVFRKGNFRSVIFHYTRNNLGQVREEHITNLQGRSQARTQYKYDQYGNVIEELVYVAHSNGFRNTRRIKMEYEFDEFGNWISCNEYDKGIPISDIIRKVEYFE